MDNLQPWSQGKKIVKQFKTNLPREGIIAVIKFWNTSLFEIELVWSQIFCLFGFQTQKVLKIT